MCCTQEEYLCVHCAVAVLCHLWKYKPIVFPKYDVHSCLCLRNSLLDIAVSWLTIQDVIKGLCSITIC